MWIHRIQNLIFVKSEKEFSLLYVWCQRDIKVHLSIKIIFFFSYQKYVAITEYSIRLGYWSCFPFSNFKERKLYGTLTETLLTLLKKQPLNELIRTRYWRLRGKSVFDEWSSSNYFFRMFPHSIPYKTSESKALTYL